jgi:ATP-dependent DNA helicase 2 subunit 2
MNASKTFEANVIFYGGDRTKNALATAEGDYQRVEEIIEMGRPSFSSLKDLQSRACGKNHGDMIDALIVAQEALMRYNKGKKYNRLMMLITDAESEVKGIDDLESVLGEMKLQESIFYALVLGDLSKKSEYSTVKKENCKMLQGICNMLGGSFALVSDLGSALSHLSSGPGLGTRPQRTKIVLEISPDFQVPCEVWTRAMKGTIPSLKKESTASGAAGVDGASSVKIDRSYRDTNENDDEIGFDQRIKGYKYGPQYIPISSADEQSFKIKGDAIIRIMGFLPYSR